ncbi:DUF4267 domain-containing protein [Alsobacter sp. KACC 23698]|uniref:DUF4267 domain-containing protein n=1 Tax=Alsobacter sp. KACC 23698 TaxID=3149229 RepID=A0AAU7J9K4_9HYPH
MTRGTDGFATCSRPRPAEPCLDGLSARWSGRDSGYDKGCHQRIEHGPDAADLSLVGANPHQPVTLGDFGLRDAHAQSGAQGRQPRHVVVVAFRALAAPVRFATYLGLPLSDEGDAPLVQVYGLRALFVGWVIMILLANGGMRRLGAAAFAAVVMAVGDAWLTIRAKASRATITRHLAIATALAAAGVLLMSG